MCHGGLSRVGYPIGVRVLLKDLQLGLCRFLRSCPEGPSTHLSLSLSVSLSLSLSLYLYIYIHIYMHHSTHVVRPLYMDRLGWILSCLSLFGDRSQHFGIQLAAPVKRRSSEECPTSGRALACQCAPWRRSCTRASLPWLSQRVHAQNDSYVATSVSDIGHFSFVSHLTGHGHRTQAKLFYRTQTATFNIFQKLVLGPFTGRLMD